MARFGHNIRIKRFATGNMHNRPHSPYGMDLALMFTLASLVALAQDSQLPNQAPDIIRGTVINSVTREPIAHALVASPDDRFATLTDGEGHFEFTLPSNSSKEAGTSAEQRPETNSVPNIVRPNSLTARKPGFLQDGRNQVNIDPASSEITIPLTPEALIVGHVSLPSSEFPDRLQVELYRRQIQDGRGRWVEAGSVSTRSNGEFRFSELQPGSYKLLTRELMDRDPFAVTPPAQSFGYPPTYFPNAAGFTSAETIHLPPGTTFQARISLVKRPYYHVKVLATNPAGGGMGVKVYAQGRGPGYGLGYDGQEQAITGWLPDGSYTIEARSFGPTPMSGSLTITVNGAPLDGARMALVSGSAVPVTVKEQFTEVDSPRPSMHVYAGPAGGSTRNLDIHLESADDFGWEGGVYLRHPSPEQPDEMAFQDVMPGRYWVKVNSYNGYAASMTSGRVDLLHQPLVVAAGASVLPIEVTLRNDGAELEGSIQGKSAPVNNDGLFHVTTHGNFQSDLARVLLIPSGGGDGDFRETTIGPDGKFYFQQIPPGTYRVLALDDPQADVEYHSAEVMRSYDSKGQTVHLVAGQKEKLELPMTSASE